MDPSRTIGAGLNNFVRKVQIHLTGKGIITGAVMLAGLMPTFVPVLIPAIIALGGIGMHMFKRLDEQWRYQDEMALKYKEEIGAKLGIDPDAVTRDHVKLAAYGDPKQGIDPNPVLAQALDRQRSKSWLVFGTAIAAAVVTFALLSAGAGVIAGTAIGGITFMGLGTILSNAGASIVAAACSLFIQDGLEFAVGKARGISTPSAHDHILMIESRMMRGKAVTPQQVFEVKLAYSPQLQERVVGMTGKPFHALKADQQEQVMNRIDRRGEMQAVADEINKGTIDATALPFILTGQQAFVRTATREEETSTHEAPRRKTFLEQLGFGDKKEQSHAERVDDSRVVPIEAGRS
ncbi:MAG: hypothetical protein ACOYJ2_05575 [Rickettsiales bacterium]